jgi:hypothetical protein
MSRIITNSTLENSISFDEYMTLTRNIVNSDEPSGMYANTSTHRYTRSNLERMQKVLDNMVVNQKLYNTLSDLQTEWIWVVITEPWCGDASWGTPALYTISLCSDKIDFRILLRDDNTGVMKAYQTAGTDSIPKLICLRKNTLEEIGTWGPRPQELHALVLSLKNNPIIDYREGVRALHSWYEQDMTKSIQEEILFEVKKWVNSK